MRRKKNMVRWLLFLLMLFMVSGCSGMQAGKNGGSDAETDEFVEETVLSDISVSELQVHYIDVGQGDATLIVCDGEAMLIDAGDNSKGTTVQLYLQKQGVKSLKYVIGTHPDADHIGGMDVIITKFDCDMIMMPDKESDSATYRDVIDAMDYRGYKNTLPTVGDTYPLGSATFTIIAPNKSYLDTNNCSIGMILVHGNNKFLFTGDAETEAEDDILNNGINIVADVLKVGHHGSSTSTGAAFLKAVDPEYAVISCGEDNSYGHPHEETLAALKKAGVKIFRTDEQGSIIAESDGKSIIWNADPSDSWKAGAVAEKNAQAASVGSSSNDGDGNDNGGKSTSGEAAEIITPQEPDDTEAVQEEAAVSAQEPIDSVAGMVTYVLNNNTKKFHYPDCYSAQKIKDSNREETTMTREEIIAKGYDPCKNCNP